MNARTAPECYYRMPFPAQDCFSKAVGNAKHASKASMKLVCATRAKEKRTYTRATKQSGAMTKGGGAELASTRKRASVPHRACGNAMGSVGAQCYHTKNFRCLKKRTLVSADAMIAFRSLTTMLLDSKSNAAAKS